jgi:hypothetical protein
MVFTVGYTVGSKNTGEAVAVTVADNTSMVARLRDTVSEKEAKIDELAAKLLRAYQDLEHLLVMSRVTYPNKPSTIVDTMAGYQSYIVDSMNRIAVR